MNESYKYEANKPLTKDDPIPMQYMVSADLLMDEVMSPEFKNLPPEEQDEKFDELIIDQVGMHDESHEINPDQITYLWQKLKFKIHPSDNKDLKRHNRESLARAIYIYLNLLEVIPEGMDRLPLDEAIEKFAPEKAQSQEYKKKAEIIMSEVAKTTEKFEKPIRVFNLKEIMKKLGYDEKAMYSIINYYREYRGIISAIDTKDANEVSSLSKAIETYEKIGSYEVKPVRNISNDAKKNITRLLTSPETQREQEAAKGPDKRKK